MTTQEFSRFYKENVDKIYRFVFLKVNSIELSQDIVSEAFLRTWKYANAKDTSIKDVRALCYRIVRNLIVDWYRKKDSETVSLEDPVITTALATTPDISPEYHASVKADISRIKEAIGAMRSEHGEAVLLHYLNDLSVREVAEAMDAEEGTVRVWLHRGLAELREKLAVLPGSAREEPQNTRSKDSGGEKS